MPITKRADAYHVELNKVFRAEWKHTDISLMPSTRLRNGPPRNSDLIGNLIDLSTSDTKSFEAGLLQHC